MEVKFLGARQGESRHTHFVSILVDGVLALDAGSITSALTLEEQARVESILLTHRHYDHIKDLATFGFNRMGKGNVGIYCTSDVLAAAQATVLNDQIWLDFFSMPSPTNPTYVHHPIEPNRAFSVGDYAVRPIPVAHAVPTVGYEIATSNGSTLLYTGDSGPGSARFWASSSPDLIITEVTYRNEDTGKAREFGHLSPRLLADELKVLRALGQTLPKIAAIHINPFYTDQVAEEIASVARELGVDIWLPDEGSVITVASRTYRAK